MLTDHGDLWTYPADARCVTTNGMLKANGELVMGAGVARQAALRYPDLPKLLGRWVSKNGGNNNTPCHLWYPGEVIISFPTKRHWIDQSGKDLIRESALRLTEIVKAHADKIRTVVMPPPGCGLGGLNWKEVKTIIDPILDDRFTVLLPRR